MNEKFFIYKTASLKSEKPDLSFVPMMTRRKLSPIARITFALMNECCGENNVNLVFSSQFGEVDRLEALILQYTDDGEVSPISFGSSVHNAAVGAFSLFRNIKNKYNAISAGKNSLSAGFLDAACEKEKTLFCYSDTIPDFRGAACLVGREFEQGADEIELTAAQNRTDNTEYERFLKFLNKETDEFKAPFYTARRVK